MIAGTITPGKSDLGSVQPAGNTTTRKVSFTQAKPRGFNELAYLAGCFDAIEINSSYYGPTRPAPLLRMDLIPFCQCNLVHLSNVIREGVALPDYLRTQSDCFDRTQPMQTRKQQLCKGIDRECS
jgi:hypothetical protein